jgi:hypothetical protein
MSLTERGESFTPFERFLVPNCALIEGKRIAPPNVLLLCAVAFRDEKSPFFERIRFLVYPA